MPHLEANRSPLIRIVISEMTLNGGGGDGGGKPNEHFNEISFWAKR